MKIVKVDRYMIGSKEFFSLAQANSHVDDLLGKHIDKIDCLLGPNCKLAILDYLTSHRKEIATLLLCTFEDPDEIPF